MSAPNKPNKPDDDLSVYAEEPTTPPTTTPGGTLSANRQQRYDSLYENYVADTKALEEERSLARQEANINHELLMKYLPTLNKMNGLHGLGVAQSANIEALANYQNNLNTIDRNYNASKSALDKDWRDRRAGLYDEQYAEDQEDLLALYNEAYDLIVAGADTKTKDEIDNYITALGLDEESKARLGNLANYLYGDGDESDAPKYTANTAVGEDGSVKINVGSVDRTLSLGELVSIPAKDASKYGEGEVFLYNNGICVKKNGNIYQVLDENEGMTSSDYSDVYNYLSSGKAPLDGNAKQLTNGEDISIISLARSFGIVPKVGEQFTLTLTNGKKGTFMIDEKERVYQIGELVDRPEDYKENESPTLKLNTSNFDNYNTKPLDLDEFMKVNNISNKQVRGRYTQ